MMLYLKIQAFCVYLPTQRKDILQNGLATLRTSRFILTDGATRRDG